MIDGPHKSLNLIALGYQLDGHLWRRPGNSAFGYSDGDEIEERIAGAVASASDRTLYSSELRDAIIDWPSLYHLSPSRSAILRPFEKELGGASILELGAGCGAVTRYLGEIGSKIVAVEGSARRARIAAERCADLSNVSVVADQLLDFRPEHGFDFVTLVGVLEYSRVYLKGSAEDPIDAVLSYAASQLSDGGTLIIAIENQLGLKYLAGHAEDHVGRRYYGIEDSYGASEVVTFGRQELQRRIELAGLTHQNWWYPFPDYKFPTLMLSERGSRTSEAVKLSDLIAQAIEADRQPAAGTFSKQLTVAALARNGLVGDLSNSFLVLASRTAIASDDRLAEYYALERRPEFAKRTIFEISPTGMSIKREKLFPNIEHRGQVQIYLDNESYIGGRNWFIQLVRLLHQPGWTEETVKVWACTWWQAFVQVAKLPASEQLPWQTAVDSRLVDAIPKNLLVTETSSHFIDLEWSFGPDVPLGLIAYRSLFSSLAAVGGIAPPTLGTTLSCLDIFKGLCAHLGIQLDDAAIVAIEYAEDAFVEQVVGPGRSVSTLRNTSLVINPSRL